MIRLFILFIIQREMTIITILKSTLSKYINPKSLIRNQI